MSREYFELGSWDLNRPDDSIEVPPEISKGGSECAQKLYIHYITVVETEGEAQNAGPMFTYGHISKEEVLKDYIENVSEHQ